MTAPAPFTPKLSIIDRVLGRLFPTDQYGGLLEPTEQRALQRQGLLQLGTGLLADTGPGNALNALGRSYQGIDFGGMADHALKLQAYRAGLAQEQAIADAARAHQPGTGATREDRYNSFADWLAAVAMLPGGAPIAEKGAALLQAMKPDRAAAQRWSFQTVMENGVPVLYRINEDTGTKYRVGLGKPSGGVQGGVMAQETKAAARNALAALNQADAVLTRDPEADIVPVLSSIAEGAGTIPLIGGALKGAMGPAAQKAMRPTQQEFQQAMDQFLHNYSALLPRGGRSVQILKNLRASFAPSAGQTDAQVRASFVQARAHLRETLTALAEGREPISPIPGADASHAPEAAGSYDDLLSP